MITNRDYEVVEFLNTYKIASTDTLQAIFFPSLRVAQQRLKMLSESRLIKRERLSVVNQFTYYVKKPKQIRHSLAITDFYRELNSVSKIAFFINECNFHNIRPDAAFGYKFNNQDKIGILEVEFSNKGFDFSKYSDNKLFSSLGVSPTIFILSNKKITIPENVLYRFELIGLDFKDIRYHIR